MTNKIDLIIDWNDTTILQSFTDIETNVEYKTIDDKGNIVTITIMEMEDDYITELWVK